ncbi:MAG: ATP-binding protein [Myxococcaceae bacterium]|nr:ATP-binding protein [Myxococcaceae bacterium]
MRGSEASRDLVDELVHQFTDPYAAYRELVQNSIDAGSNRIEVTLAFRPGTDGGLMTASVRDWGEGMSQKVIDDYLLTKFRSSKENDLTKIGKYGIGFVSVFALKPDAVTVDTGRDGESWRVLFRQDRTYELLKLSEPVEGTTVTLHTRATAAQYEEHVARTRAALARWCRHSEVDVAFAFGGVDGSAAPEAVTLHEPVAVDAVFQVEHKEEGLHVVLGPARVLPATSGFYNRGLTLLETTEQLLPGLALKVVSATLEHTLTRDNVKRDEAFARAIGVAKRLAEGPLLELLPGELTKAAERKDGANDWRALFQYAAQRVPKKALTLRAPGGGAVPPKLLSSALVVAPARTPLTERLVATGTSVLEAHRDDPLALGVSKALGAAHVMLADALFTYAEPTTAAAPSGFAAALTELLAGAKCPVEGVALARVRGAGETEAWVFIEALGRPIVAAAATKKLERKKKHGLLCLNVGHEAVESTLPLMQRAPRLSALLWARQLLVRQRLLDPETDAYLTSWALS